MNQNLEVESQKRRKFKRPYCEREFFCSLFIWNYQDNWNGYHNLFNCAISILSCVRASELLDCWHEILNHQKKSLKWTVVKGAFLQKWLSFSFFKVIVFMKISITENIFVVFAMVLEISLSEVCYFIKLKSVHFLII